MFITGKNRLFPSIKWRSGRLAVIMKKNASPTAETAESRSQLSLPTTNMTGSFKWSNFRASFTNNPIRLIVTFTVNSFIDDENVMQFHHPVTHAVQWMSHMNTVLLNVKTNVVSVVLSKSYEMSNRNQRQMNKRTTQYLFCWSADSKRISLIGDRISKLLGFKPFQGTISIENLLKLV